MKEQLIIKYSVTAGIFILTLLCSYTPWLIRAKVKNSSLVMGYLNCLAGGVVMGTLLLHMVPHAYEECGGNEDEHEHKHKHGKHSSHHHQNGHQGDGDNTQGNNGQDPDQQQQQQGNNNSGKKNKDKNKKKKEKKHHKHEYPYGLLAAGISFFLLFAIDRLFLTHSHCEEGVITEKGGDDHGHGHVQKKKENTAHSHHLPLSIRPARNDSISPTILKDIEAKAEQSAAACDPEQEPSSESDHGSCHSADVMAGCHMDGIKNASSKIQSFIFVLALSVHSFLEGLGLAATNSDKGVISFTIGLLAHKWLEAFALGVSVMKANFSPFHRHTLIYVYSILTPIGILIGMVIEEAAQGKAAHEVVSKVLNGLAAGSFLFVGCIEMIPPEFHRKSKHTKWKFVTLVFGFVIMAAVASLHSHGHDHDHGDNKNHSH